MWKPGAQKPREEPTTGDRESGKNQETKKHSAPLRKKELSGSTMRLRFMQRTTANEPEDGPEDESMDMDEAVMRAQHDGNVTGEKDFVVATPLEMYGIHGTLLGRRSFGAFRISIEEAWKSSLHYQKHGTLTKEKQKATDEELLKRYQDFVKNDRQSEMRPVENHEDKIKARKRRKSQLKRKRSENDD